MAATTTKTLKLRIVSDIQGQAALELFEKSLKDVGVEVGKFTTSSTIAADGTTTFTHAINVQTDSLAKQNKVVQESNRLKKEGSARGTSVVIQDPAKDLRERERLAAGFDATRLQKAKELITLKTIEETKGINSIEAFRESQRQKEIARERRLQAKLANIRKQFAQGDISFIQQGAARNKEIEAYERSILAIKKATSAANAKNLAQMERQAKATRDVASAQARVVTGTRSVIRAHRAWSVQIAEGIGLYRAISFAISGISRSILAIPRIGIERQTTEAVFESTLGSGAASAAAFKALKEEAQRTGIAITTLRETFRNLNASMSLAGESTDTTFKIFSNINTVSTALHLSADKTSNVFLALAQIFNKTKVQSEELVKQLGNLLPGAFASFQKANASMFASTQDLIKQMSLGTVFAHQTVENFTEFLAERFALGFASASVGLQANLGRLSTSFTELGEAIFKVSKGPMVSFVKGATAITEALTSAVEGTSALSTVLEGLLVVAISAATLGVIKLLSKIASLTILIPRASGVLTSLVAVKVFSWANLGAKAIAAFRIAVSSLGGPIGVAVTGLILLARHLGNVNQKATEAKLGLLELRAEQAKILNKQEISIDVVIDKNEEIQKAKHRLVDLQRIAKELTEKANSENYFDNTPANKEKARAARALAANAQEVVNDLIEAETIKHNKFLAEQRQRQNDLDADLNRQKIESATRTAQTIQNQTSIANRAEIASLERKLALELISEEAFYKKKKELLLKDISDRTGLEIAKQAFSPATTDQGKAEEQLALSKLRQEAEDVKATIAQEIALKNRRRTTTRGGDNTASLEKAKQEALKDIEIRLLRIQGLEDEASRREINNEAKLAKEKFNTASASDEYARRQIENIRTISQENLKEESFLNKMSESRETALDSYGYKQDLISARAQTGLQGQLSTMLMMDSAAADYLVKEEARVTNLEAKAKTGGNAIVLEAQKAREELELLKAKGTEVANFIANSLANSMADAFVGFIDGSKSASQAMADFATSILKQAARIAAQEAAMAILKGIVNIASAYYGGSTGGTTGSFQASDLGGSLNTTSLTTFANGGVSSGLSSASSSILSTPTYFPNAKVTPLASGGVVAGEAGAEAVMPLKRLSSGKLGISADLTSGGGSGTIIQQLIVNVTQSEDETSEEQSKAIGKAIKQQLDSLVDTKLQLSKRAGGIMNPTQMQTTF